MRKKIYIALPYSGVEEKSFKIANKIAGKIINEGNIPMSPVSHSHPISIECNVDGDWDFWKDMDCSFIDWSDEVMVVVWDEELIEKSTGVQAEIKYANETGKKVTFLNVDDNGEIKCDFKIKLPSGMDIELHLPNDFDFKNYSSLEKWQEDWVNLKNNSFDDWVEIEGVGRFKNLRIIDSTDVVHKENFELTITYVYDDLIEIKK